MERLSIAFGRNELVFETGRLAKQANGAVLGQTGGTTAMVAVVAGPPREGIDFFPLQIDYRDKFYGAGRIPGNFFRREARPSDPETLRARLIDRPLRPLFPKTYHNDTQIYVTILSSDSENPPDLVALNAASMAVQISDIPFPTPVAGVRIGRVDGKFIVNPTYAELEEGDLDLIVAGTEEAINMVEAGAKEVPEDDLLEALELAHNEIKRLCREMSAFAGQHGKQKMELEEPEDDTTLRDRVEPLAMKVVAEIQAIAEKGPREDRLNEGRTEIKEALAAEFPEQEKDIAEAYDEIYQREVRRKILEDKSRADGRGPKDIRTITSEVKVLPRTHGSAVFTRGQTQSLGVTTLGTKDDQQLIDDLLGVHYKGFFFHYNFPSYSVGETRPIRGPGRREIGHGMLAERALLPAIPTHDDFPYTIRVVSEILESNGSSSMASVCAGCLSLMDAGVPLTSPVSGIAMGLVKEGDNYVILSDILGLEDHLGDMDFKVAGTRKGVTALQMDIKIAGITADIMKDALHQAQEGRMFILDRMAETLAEPRSEMSPYAPRIEMIQIPIDRIRDVIGPGGKMIRAITEETNTRIDIEDDGRVFIAAYSQEEGEAAINKVKELTAVAELGKVYTGKVVRVTDFGCFVQILPNQDGLVHISELENHRVEKVEDVCREGDTLKVKVIEIDDTGRVRLSRRQAADPDAPPESGRGGGRPGGGGRGGDRGGRGGDRGGRGGDRGGRGDRRPPRR